MLWRWIYVSRSMVEASSVRPVLAGLVQTSALRNADLGVTGALLVSGGRFAQFLEGNEASILKLKESICQDHRHSQVTPIDWDGQHQARQFEGWSLAYFGSANFFAPILQSVQLGSNRQSPNIRNEIRTIFAEFATGSKPKG